MPKKKLKLLGGAGQCIFCFSDEDDEEAYGKFVHKKAYNMHYFCMLFSSGLMQRGADTTGVYGFLPLDIFTEVKRGRKLRCQYCKKHGATIGCVVKSCRTSFHLPCGRKRGSLHQFYDQFCSYCPEHRPLQHMPPRVTDAVANNLPSKSSSNCLICMNPVDQFPTNESIFTVCCDNAWLHRQCVQKNATSAGIHFFKCPLCNNREDFQLEMRELGIYIPDQDAAWEREPNAYQDLLERYCHCDCVRCKCPHGRNFNKDNSKWEILVCKDCGSQACHVACDGLKHGIIWTCPTCMRIGEDLRKKNKGKKKSVEDIREVAKQLEESYTKLEAKLLSGPSTSGAQAAVSKPSFLKKTLVTCSQTDASTSQYKASRHGRRRGLRTDQFQDSILKSETVTISDSSDQMQDVDVLNFESSNDNDDKESSQDNGRNLRHTRRVNYTVQNSKQQHIPPEFRALSPLTVSDNSIPKKNESDSQFSLHTRRFKRKRGSRWSKGVLNMVHERNKFHKNVDAKRTPPKGTGLLLQHLKSQMQDEDTNSSGISIASTSSASAGSDSWPPTEEHTSTRIPWLRSHINSDQHAIDPHLDKKLSQRQNSNSSSLSSVNGIRKTRSVRFSPRFVTSRKLSDSSTTDSIIELPSTSAVPEADDANNNNTPPPDVQQITPWYELNGLSYEEYEKQNSSALLSQRYDPQSSLPNSIPFETNHSVNKGYSVHSINKSKSPALNGLPLSSASAESCELTFGKHLIPLEPQYDDIYDGAVIHRCLLGMEASQTSLSGTDSQNDTEPFIISDDDSDIVFIGSDLSNTQSDYIQQYGPNSTAAAIASQALSARDQNYQKQFSAAQLQETYDYHDNLVSSGVRMETCRPGTSPSSIPARYSISDPGNVSTAYQTGEGGIQGVQLVSGGIMGPVLQREHAVAQCDSLSSTQASAAAAEWWPVIGRVTGSSSLHNMNPSYPPIVPILERVGGSLPYSLNETHPTGHSSSRLIQRVSPFRYQPDTDLSVPSHAQSAKDYHNDIL